jgi:hypothetical protein
MPFISEVEAIWIQRFYTGWLTLRNQLTTPIKMMGRRVIELYDALIAGNDWECTPYLSLKRRAGHTALVTLNYPALYMYSWKTNTGGTIPIYDTTGDVEFVSGSNVLKTKNAANTSESSIFGVGDFLYVSQAGAQGIQFKNIANVGVSNWGILNTETVTGPTTAGNGANTTGGGGTNWVNPNNVTSSVSYATWTNANIGAQYLIATQFGFSLSAGAIAGIQVTLNIGITGSVAQSVYIGLWINGAHVGGYKTPAITPGAPISYTLGGPGDNWSSSLTYAQVNQANFGISIQPPTGAAITTTSVNDVVMTVYQGVIPTATPSVAGGSFSAVNGYSYVVAYGNSASGEISNATTPSANTGPFTNKAYVGVPVVASTDPQVNQIRVYRTTDSGGGNQFFEIANSPFANTTATIQDTTPDLSLQVTSQAEINLGNTPPPAGLVNLEYFAGRMWGSTNNLLWASTGPETISGTAPNSNWNPLFQWVIPGVIVRNVTGPNGMLVFTQDDCYIVRGTDITNYTVNEFVKDFGIRSYNAVDTDGTNLYVFTSDRQFICVSASGANDLGLPIGDQLLNVNPNTVYVRVNRYGLDSIVRILDTVNNVYYDYNLNQQCWNLPGILQMPACSAMGSIEVTPGVWRLLLCSTSSGVSQLAYRDINNFQDLGTSYAPKAVFGSIQLADPGSLAKFGALGGLVMEYTNAGTVPTLSVLLNDMGATLSNAIGSQITGSFTSLSVAKNPFNWPPTLGAQAIAYRSLGYYLMYGVSKGGSNSGFVRHMQFQLSAPAENKATELIGFGIFGDLKQESESAGAIPALQGR